MEKAALIELLTQIPSNKVFFGPQGFDVFSNLAQFDKGQIGFGVDELGKSLSGENVGQWRATWCVIAIDTELGDPYFIDLSDQKLPVYTGFYGESGWQIDSVSSSLEGFLQCLITLYSQGQQSAAVFVAEQDTVTESTILMELQAKLTQFSEREQFWLSFFACYQDWLSEDY